MDIKSISVAIALSLLAGWGSTNRTFAQVSSPPSAVQPSSQDVNFLARAKNLARQAGINANGGLEAYRPELSMFGPALKSPYTKNPDGSVTFKFLGSAPGSSVFAQETVATVSPDSTVTIVYNGPIRGANPGADLSLGGLSTFDETASNPATTNTTNPSPVAVKATGSEGNLAILDEATFIARARNLARQLGIKENGGLDQYRPEASMFGPTSNSPHTIHSDGSVTFTFKGGAPAFTTPTVETEVLVTREGQVSLQYNGVIR